MDQSGQTNTQDGTDAGRSHVVARVIEQVRSARAAGESLDDQAIISANPELMPELGHELDKLRRIEAAWAATAAGPAPASAPVGPAEIELAKALAADLERPAIEVPGYTVLREIGRGGQAVVFLAFKLNPGRRVALKVMRDGSLADDRALARFKLEAGILADLNHPNIVTIFETGLTADGSHYFAMNFIAGCGLDEFMHRCQKMDPDPSKLLRLFFRICDIVNAAHVKQIVHRDLKPGNIRVDERGEPHILDFGLARPAPDRTAGSEPVSVTGEFLGSLPWSSPEQAAGDRTRIDVRTDVYSLGVILYQMLTGGRFPYEVVGNIRDVLNNIVSTQPTPPSKVIAAVLAKDSGGTRRLATKHPPAVNEAIEKIVLKALAKQPEQRYQNAGELGRAIADYLLGRGTTASARVKKRRSTGRSPRRIAAITAVAAALVGITLWQILPPAESPMKPSRLIKSLVLLVTTGAFGGPKPAAPDNAPHLAGLAVPDAATQAKKEKLIRDVFGNFNAAPLAERPAIAVKMLEQGMATADDPAARYVLLKDGGELAASAGDAATAMRGAALLASVYAVDGGELKLALLRKSTAAATTPAVAAAVAREGLNCANEALSAGNYDLANRFMLSTEQAARTSRDVTLVVSVQSRAADIKWLQQESVRAKTAQDKLTKTPTDPDANHTLGRFFCLVRGDWTHGLIGLSKGSNHAYHAAATADLANPTTTDKQVAAGDLWWNIAEKETAGAAQRALRRRAGFWYAQALANPQFAGLSRALVEKKLSQIPPPGPGEAVAEVPQAVAQPNPTAPPAPVPVRSNEPPTQAPAASAEMIAFSRQRSAMPPEQQMPATLARLKQLNGGVDIKADVTVKDGEIFLDMREQDALVNIEPLYGMRVTNLNLGECRNLKSLNGLQGMPLTGLLNLHNCWALEDISALKGMKLSHIGPSECHKLKNLDALQGMPLTPKFELNLTHCDALEDISGLKGMQLTSLILTDCKNLKSLNGTQGMPLTILMLPKHLAQGNIATIVQAFPALRILKTGDPKMSEEADAAIKSRKGLAPAAYKPPPGGSIFGEATAPAPAPAISNSSGAVTNSIGMKLVPIPAGEFMMGSPADEKGRFDGETLHKVKITRPFMMAATTVTQAQWKAVMGVNPSFFRASPEGSTTPREKNFTMKGDDLPVEQVSWNDAVAFCEKLGAKEGRHYRLPTEAEWEYACRAGTQTPFGDGRLDEVAWYGANSGKLPHDVATKKPNRWGLYDMIGNVWQWCSDGYGPYGGDAIDPQGGDDTSMRITRGGSWVFPPSNCRAAMRRKFAPVNRNSDVAFRVCMDNAQLPGVAAPAPANVPPPAGNIFTDGPAPEAVAALNALLNDPAHWTVKKGTWNNTPGKLHGEGDSEIWFDTALPRDSSLQFQINMINGHRPRLDFYGTDIKFAPKDDTQALIPEGARGDSAMTPVPYANNHPRLLKFKFFQDRFEIEIDNKLAFASTCKPGKQYQLRFHGGDARSPGIAEFSGFRVEPIVSPASAQANPAPAYTPPPGGNIFTDGPAPAASNLAQTFARERNALPADQQIAATVVKLKEVNGGHDMKPEIQANADGTLRVNILNQDALVSIEPLYGLKVTKLNLYSCKNLRSLSGVEGMPLTELSVTYCPALEGDLSVLKGMRLTQLNLTGCQGLRSLNGIQGMPLTGELSLAFCSGLGGDLSALAGMRLTKIQLQTCQRLKSLNGIQGMALTELNLSYMYDLEDLLPLKGMRLTKILLPNCRTLKDLSGLEGAPLKELELPKQLGHANPKAILDAFPTLESVKTGDQKTDSDLATEIARRKASGAAATPSPSGQPGDRGLGGSIFGDTGVKK
jgi:formylglycine-generating enzyme required for sulfatase activity/serine/threonine protein kinase